MTLIERLEKAGEGSRELDEQLLLATGHAVLTDWNGQRWTHERVGIIGTDCHRPTQSQDAACAFQRRVLPGWYCAVQPWFHTDPERVMHRAYVIRPDWTRWNPVDDDWCEARSGPSAATPALALCLAVLRATQEQPDV